MLDIANHIVARRGLGAPKTYRESITALVPADILPRKHLETFQRMVVFRNRAVDLGDFNEFIAPIVHWLSAEDS